MTQAGIRKGRLRVVLDPTERHTALTVNEFETMMMKYDLAAVLRSRTFREYDRLFTAPLHGFADEQDYWTRASSGPYLPRIRRPTLLINATNDPFMPAESLPRAAVERSRWLEAEFVTQGGHVGFLDGALGRSSWAERRALAFLGRHLLR